MDEREFISNQYESQLFAIRIWAEHTGKDEYEWRGKAQHVTSGKIRFFRDWSKLTDFLQEVLDQSRAVQHACSEPMKPDSYGPRPLR